MKDKIETPFRGEIIIYQNEAKDVQLEVKLEGETLWLSQKQIALLFGTQRPAITKHLYNIFRDKELEENSACSILEHTALDGKVYSTKFYNLDAIISVGYRVNSSRATQFRIWATNILKNHLVDGYTLNEKRLKEYSRKFQELQQIIKLIGNVKNRKQLNYKEAVGLIDVINDYNYALGLLDDYDYRTLITSRISTDEKFKLTYKEAKNIISQLKKKIGNSTLFGTEKDESFKSSIETIYQTFSGKDLYPSIEEKAVHLLYFIVKNHSFIDGNKRIAASIFLYFLQRNQLLYKENGLKRIADNALVALTLMMAESNPKEKDIIVKLAVNLINKNN